MNCQQVIVLNADEFRGIISALTQISKISTACVQSGPRFLCNCHNRKALMYFALADKSLGVIINYQRSQCGH